jgi:hypothetical protein
MDRTAVHYLREGPLSNHPVDVGQRSEAAVLASFVKLGLRVLTPFGTNHRYDFVLDLGSRFVRVQCKTGRLRGGAIKFSARSIRSNRRGNYCRPYLEEIDLFAIYCPDTEAVYALPVEEATSSVGTLRVDPPANGQARGIRWAADFQLPA